MSPKGDGFRVPDGSAIEEEADEILAEAERHRLAGQRVVVIQGLGFVGSAVAAVVAAARDENNNPRYYVIGVDLATGGSFWKIASLNQGLAPFASSDPDFELLIQAAVLQTRNLRATASERVYEIADTIIVDVNLDARHSPEPSGEITVDIDSLEKALRVIGQRMKPDALVLIETTVPLGTCEYIVEPLLREERAQRGITAPLKVAHAYERVMPGPQYVASIRSFWRSYSGIDTPSAIAAEEFLSTLIDTKTYPLRRLDRPAASEMAKLLENSYRAVNIAFMYEWTLLAEKTGVNLFEIVESIRLRKGTHDNMRYPGFGVGGYCLTKDSHLAQWGARNLFHADVTLDMTMAALRINRLMPRHTLELIRETVDGSLRGTCVAVLGVSYLADVADTRSSPSELLLDDLKAEGANFKVHDPLVQCWLECPEISISQNLEETLKGVDAIVLAVPHKEYRSISGLTIAKNGRRPCAVIDAQNILSDNDAARLVSLGHRVVGVGKGHWRRLNYHLVK